MASKDARPGPFTTWIGRFTLGLFRQSMLFSCHNLTCLFWQCGRTDRKPYFCLYLLEGSAIMMYKTKDVTKLHAIPRPHTWSRLSARLSFHSQQEQSASYFCLLCSHSLLELQILRHIDIFKRTLTLFHYFNCNCFCGSRSNENWVEIQSRWVRKA